jgi:hypothetical protein
VTRLPRPLSLLAADKIDALVVTGARRIDRAAFEATAPVDIATAIC